MAKLYKFKWGNMDLDDYIKSARVRAKNMRIEANILVARANQIADEVSQLEGSLVESDEKTGETQ